MLLIKASIEDNIIKSQAVKKTKAYTIKELLEHDSSDEEGYK
jgi:hypothetical protein